MAESYMRPVRFWEEYSTKADGTIQTREMVELAHPNMQHMATNVVWIRPTTKAASDWGVIAPHYEAWRQGQAAPETGTPLGAWPGLTQEQAEIFKAAGVRSVEDVAAMTDRVMTSIKLPNMQRFKSEAKLFLQASDQRATQMRLQQQAEEIAALKDTLADMADNAVLPATDMPKRRGRPPRAAAVVEEVEAPEGEEE